MNRKEFLELALMGAKVMTLTAENEIDRTISIVHGAILETFVINEHLDILNIEETMKDGAIQYIIEQTNIEIVYDLLERTRRFYMENLEEEWYLI